MRISRLIWRRHFPGRRLAKCVCVCLLACCLLFVACRVSVVATWRPFLSVLSARKTERNFIGNGGKVEKLSIYKPEWVGSVRSGLHSVNRAHQKWQILFVTDDNNQSLTALKSSERFTQKRPKNKNIRLSGSLSSNNDITPGRMSWRYKVVGQAPPIRPLTNPRQKTILLWTTFFGKARWLSSDKFDNCSISGWPATSTVPPCRISSDKSELNTSDLVIMHANDINAHDLPSFRTAHQRWLFYCQESPKHMYLDLSKFSGMFNYTSVTRRDADYVFRHGEAVLKETPTGIKKFRRKFAEIMALKKRLAVARISNCEPKERLEYINELRKFIHVDFFGTCGDQKCPKTDEACNGSKMAAYKFYLAFENSRCKDYITEKFWRPLHHWNSVPVVMGGAGPEDYRDVAPPHSYINTADFDSPRELAKYLLLLDRNQTLFEEYFRWRRFYGNRRQKDHTWCKVCADLHDSSKPSQFYTDLKSWYRQDSCIPSTKYTISNL